MNLTLIGAVTLLLVWLILLVTGAVTAGVIHLLYAGAVVLLARRVVVGAPRFLS